uniref:RPAP1/MINIYO-like TPR repeats domain-containing protein n=1 Tax=Ciona savignyi TaxID=51511 RepID=H2ZD66_CIOSA
MIPTAAKLVRLMCVFLAGNELFLDEIVQVLLNKLLKLFIDGKSVKHLDFEQDIPGITSFYDFYISLLEQFAAVSFGNSTFSTFILLPMVARSSPQLKLALWSERSEALASIRIDQVPVSEEYYFDPIESNGQVLAAYLRALAGGAIQSSRNPFVYRLALHHVASAVQRHETSKDEKEVKPLEALIKSVKSISNVTLKHKILNYNFNVKNT